MKHFFRIALRTLYRNKIFSIINVAGLGIGMAAAMLIFLWVQNELSYDNFHTKGDRLFQVWNKSNGDDGRINCWNITPKPVSAALKHEYPEVEQATRVGWDESYLFSVGEKKMNVTGVSADNDFLTMFDFPLLKGDQHTALSRPFNIVITQQLSEKLFGQEEAMGKLIRIDNKFDYTVSGIMKDLPNNTQFTFEYLLPWHFMQITHQDDSSWDNNSTHNYVLLKPQVDVAAFNRKIADLVIRHGEPGWTTQAFLYPLSKLHLYDNFENGVPAGGKIRTVKVFTLTAFFILVIACINFMNMSTARSEKRAREVGIRKVAGAHKKGLIARFLGESILTAFLAGMLCLLLVQLCLPAFNGLVHKRLVIGYGDADWWMFFTGFMVFTGVLAGSYPAFYLSSFRPATVLKGAFKKTGTGVTPRKVLVVVQFTVAIVMMVSTLVVRRQILFAQGREPGYDKKGLVYIFLNGDMNRNLDRIKTDLISQGIATSVTKTSAPITEGWSSGGIEWQGKPVNDRTAFNFYHVDGGIVKTAGLTLLQGRDIDVRNYPTDSTAVLLNEAAVKVMGFRDPIGRIVDTGGGNAMWHVVGIVKDFIIQSPYEPVKPMIIRGPKADWFNLLHIKFNEAHSTAENLAATEKIFKQYNPLYPFEYHFVDEVYAIKFADEQTTATLTALFSGLTIFISCLGLFGLAAYMAQNRIKEIGVRKVLGASVRNITTLLSGDFVKLVIFAILVATPVAWWIMNRWLSSYAYRTDIPAWIFLLAGGVTVLISLLTVGFQAIRAAMANPVTSLRSE